MPDAGVPDIVKLSLLAAAAPVKPVGSEPVVDHARLSPEIAVIVSDVMASPSVAVIFMSVLERIGAYAVVSDSDSFAVTVILITD